MLKKYIIMKVFFLLFGTVLCFNKIIHSQEFKKNRLTKNDIAKGIISRYRHISDDGYNSWELLLFKNKNYCYIKTGHGENGFNKGKWNENGKILELKSIIIRIIYQ
jgi:hypothetical protein